MKWLLWLVGIAGACDPSPALVDAGGPDAAAAIREVSVVASIAESGISEPVAFTVPDNTRSLTIVAVGHAESLYALASLRTADGIDHVNVDLDGSYGEAMEASYYDEQIGQMPGDLFQSIRLGTFTHVFPYAPGQELPAGEMELRLASNATSGDVAVSLIMPEEDGAAVLHVNVLAIADSFSLEEPLSFLDEAQEIFDAAGIQLVVDEVLTLTGTGFDAITDFSEPQEAPDSMSALLAAEGPGYVASDALNVFVVEELPSGVGGLSLGTPGPPVATSYYYGVLLRHSDQDSWMARVFAHEVAHFLALQHLENVGVSGDVVLDPLDDTEVGEDNLMESGTELTMGQTFALTRSALLSRE